jgi:hypothetical protein
MLFDTERATRAPDEKTYEELTKKIESHTKYSRVLLSICTQRLHIPEGRVLQARREYNKAVYRVHHQRC